MFPRTYKNYGYADWNPSHCIENFTLVFIPTCPQKCGYAEPFPSDWEFYSAVAKQVHNIVDSTLLPNMSPMFLFFTPMDRGTGRIIYVVTPQLLCFYSGNQPQGNFFFFPSTLVIQPMYMALLTTFDEFLLKPYKRAKYLFTLSL